MLNLKKRQENEKKFPNWQDLPDGSRVYWFEIKGRLGWKARYVKSVNKEEETLSFRQEIFNEQEILVEVHEKFPIDKGHKKMSHDNYKTADSK